MKTTNKLTRIGSIAALAVGGLAIMVALVVSPAFAKSIPDDNPKPESSETAAPSSPSQGDEVEFKGTVEAISGDLWTIGGVTFKVSAATMFRGTPAVGSFVEVTGDLQSDGSWLARAIKIEDSTEFGDDNGQDGNGETDDSGMDSPSDLDDSDEDFHNSNPGSGVDDSGPKVEDGTHHQRGKDGSGSGRHGADDGPNHQ